VLRRRLTALPDRSGLHEPPLGLRSLGNSGWVFPPFVSQPLTEKDVALLDLLGRCITPETADFIGFIDADEGETAVGPVVYRHALRSD
jgi:hypothetical protein